MQDSLPCPVTFHRSQLIWPMLIKFSTYNLWKDIHSRILTPHQLLTISLTQFLNIFSKNLMLCLHNSSERWEWWFLKGYTNYSTIEEVHNKYYIMKTEFLRNKYLTRILKKYRDSGEIKLSTVILISFWRIFLFNMPPQFPSLPSSYSPLTFSPPNSPPHTLSKIKVYDLP